MVKLNQGLLVLVQKCRYGMMDLVQPGRHLAGAHLVQSELGQLPELVGFLDAQFAQA